MGHLHGPTARPIVNSSDSATIAVAGETTVYTKAIDLTKFQNMAVAVKCDSAGDGTVNVKVELEQGIELPDTEGSADTSWAVPETAPISLTITDEDQHGDNLSPIPFRYGRLKLTGLTGNAADVSVTAYLSATEED